MRLRGRSPLRAMGCVLLVMCCAVSSGASPIFSQNFESGLGANESIGGNGISPFSINTTGYGNNGTHMMGNPTTYGNNAVSYYLISNLNLTGYSDAQVSLQYAGQLETSFDFFTVDAGTTTYSHLPQLAGSTVSNPATGTTAGTMLLNLTSYVGQTINLRFQMTSDTSVVYAGVNFDNIVISGTPTPEPASLGLAGCAAAVLLTRRRLASGQAASVPRIRR